MKRSISLIALCSLLLSACAPAATSTAGASIDPAKASLTAEVSAAGVQVISFAAGSAPAAVELRLIGQGVKVNMPTACAVAGYDVTCKFVLKANQVARLYAKNVSRAQAIYTREGVGAPYYLNAVVDR